MYGQGNYSPQFGQGLQRPMPPYQQRPTGHPPQQPGPTFQVPPRPSGYPQPPPFPQNIGQQAPPISMPNTANSFMRPPPNLHHGPPFQPPYPGAQQNYGPGMQNPNHALSLPPPPPPSSLCPPRAPQPPPPAHGQVVYGAHNTPQGIPDMPLQPPMRLGAATAFRPSNFEPAKQPMYSESQIPSMAPPPPPPPPFPVSSPAMPPPPPSNSSPPKPSPPASPSSVNAVAGTSLQSGNGPSSASDVTTHLNSRDDLPASDEHLLPSQNVIMDLLPPPPKPEDETIVRNIEVLCKYIAKNGPDFEDTARQNGSGKPEFVFLFGGEPGSQASCAREYYLWMKKKYGLVRDRDLSQGLVGAECSENLNSLPAEGTAHSPVDSDVDMEDDITQSEKELGVYNFAEDIKPNSISTGDMHEMSKQINDVQLSIESSPTLNLSQTPEQPIEPEQQSVQMNTVDSPIKLIQNYSSDSSSDDNDENLTCNETSKTKVESPPCEFQPTTSHSDMVNDNITPEFGQVSEPGVDHSAPAYIESVFKKDIDNFETVECGAQDKAYEIPSQEKSASSPSAAIRGNYALENSAYYSYERGGSIGGANLTHKETVKEKENKKTSTKSKVDEFGRLVKEGSSESESDDSYLVRRHKRGRSRSRSRSPSDRRRRRSPRQSPRRRKDRRSRSPRRSRSRSRSPYRHADRVGYEKTRQDKAQMPQCFDFLKGRCYRGASCRYLHHEADKNESSRPYKRKQHQPDMVSSRNSGLDGGDGSSVNDEKHDAGGLASKSNVERSKDLSIHDTMGKGGETSVADVQKGEASTVEGSHFEEVSDKPMHHENTNFFDMPSMNDHENNHSEAEASAQPNYTPKTDSESKVDSSTIQTHAVTSHEVHVSVSEPYTGNVSHMFAVAGDVTSQPLIPHIPPPHLLQQAANAPQGSEPVDDKSMVPAIGFAPQPAHAGNVSAYQAPLSNQQSQYLTPPNSVWGIMPPMQPPPLYMSEPSMPGPPLHFPQFQQGSVRSHAMELPSHSQVGGFQHQPYNLHLNNLPTQPFGGANLVSDHLDRDPSRFAGIGGSKISAHYNPYASTFDQPLNTRFTSATFTQTRDGVAGSKYGGSVGQTSGELVLSPNSSKARGKSLLKSGGHQYDPLFDSIEPSVEPFEKHDHMRDHAGDNSDKLKMLSSHYKVLDVEENNKQNEIGAVAGTMSLENDEFGETADAEVGAVENGSPSEADEDAIVAEGKTKKSKDSRSMKLFKIAVANFVKEVLKPQWRQGNMSKEVFKTIVKKTVDKVSGAMKNHRIPKSQEKIDHYIDSSRRKLTQLVEGYVSKYKS